MTAHQPLAQAQPDGHGRGAGQLQKLLLEAGPLTAAHAKESAVQAEQVPRILKRLHAQAGHTRRDTQP